MSAQDGGPAFPVIGAPGASEDFAGMTLRDYFAAKALAECIRVADHQTPDSPTPRLSGLFDKAATYAYFAADAMLRTRAE